MGKKSVVYVPMNTSKEINKIVTVEIKSLSHSSIRRNANKAKFLKCNQFYLTVEKIGIKNLISFPLSKIDLSYDHLNNILKLEVNCQAS